MKISIITVVYNNRETVEEAIASVGSQSYDDIEYIIVDGQSTDGTLDIIRANKDRISRFVSEPDKGIYDAMNKGIRMATGDIIGILNSDDLYADKDVLKDVAAAFTNDRELDVLYGNLVYVRRFDTDKVVRNWISRDYHPRFFEKAEVPPHPTLFVRADVYRKAGAFNLSYKLASDYEFMLRIFKKHDFKIRYMNRLMIRMRLGGATNNSFKNILNGNREILRSWRDNDLTPPLLLMPIRIIKKVLQFF